MNKLTPFFVLTATLTISGVRKVESSGPLLQIPPEKASQLMNRMYPCLQTYQSEKPDYKLGKLILPTDDLATRKLLLCTFQRNAFLSKDSKIMVGNIIGLFPESPNKKELIAVLMDCNKNEDKTPDRNVLLFVQCVHKKAGKLVKFPL